MFVNGIPNSQTGQSGSYIALGPMLSAQVLRQRKLGPRCLRTESARAPAPTPGGVAGMKFL